MRSETGKINCKLFRPLGTHQRSTEKMRPNLIAMKNKDIPSTKSISSILLFIVEKPKQADA